MITKQKSSTVNITKLLWCIVRFAVLLLNTEDSFMLIDMESRCILRNIKGKCCTWGKRFIRLTGIDLSVFPISNNDNSIR